MKLNCSCTVGFTIFPYFIALVPKTPYVELYQYYCRTLWRPSSMSLLFFFGNYRPPPLPRSLHGTPFDRLIQKPLHVSIHILHTVVLDYGELLAYWFILHGCSTLDRGSRPVLFHDSLAGFTMKDICSPTRACTGGSCGMLDRAGHPYFHPYLWPTLLCIHTCAGEC